MEPNHRPMLKRTFFPKIKKIAKRLDLDKLHTQKERAQLIFDLKVLHELAYQAAQIPPKGKFTKERQKCAQLAAYIARSINIIATGYDTMKIKEILAEITERVSKLEQLRKAGKKSKGRGHRPRKRQ